MNRAPLIVAALDMADGTTLREFAAAGKLPNLAQWLEQGRYTDLDSPARLLHTAAWPSFATGRSPGEHGIYFPLQPRPNAQGPLQVDDSQLRAPCFWQHESLKGPTLVADLPESFAATLPDGDFIQDWGTWAHYGPTQSRPDAWLEQLKSQHGDYPLSWEATRLGLKLPEPARLTRELCQAIEHKARVYAQLVSQRDYQLAVLGFAELHAAGHYLWGQGDRFVRVWRSLDDALGKLAAALPQTARLTLVSVDGCRTNYPHWHWLPDCLRNFGYSGAVREQGQARRPGLVAFAKSLVRPGARRWIADHLPSRIREQIAAREFAAQTDWANTRAYCLPTDLEGYIRINLQGREPEGCVAAADFDATCDELKRDLLSLRDADTGEPVVDEVTLSRDAFPGAAGPQLPDLIVTWRQKSARAIHSAHWPAHLEPLATPPPDRRPGTHGTRGFLLETRHAAQAAPTEVCGLADYFLQQLEQTRPHGAAPKS